MAAVIATRVPEAIVIVDQYSELQYLRANLPELRQAPVIFTMVQFVPEELDELSLASTHVFDEQITPDDAREMARTIDHHVWHWFVDERGRDLSLLDGCSLGAAFATSLEYLFNTLLRYQVGFSKLLKADHQVYCLAQTEETVLTVLRQLQRTVGFVLHVVDGFQLPVVTHGAWHLKFDGPFWRTLDVRSFFRPRRLCDGLLTRYLRIIQWLYGERKCLSKPRVLIMPGGKLANFLTYAKKRSRSGSLEFILPLRSLDWRHFHCQPNLFYYFSVKSQASDPRLEKIIATLRQHIRKTVSWIDADALVPLLDQFVFSCFPLSFSYYQNVRQWLSKLKPDVAVIAAEAETHSLGAMAARSLGITTAFLPHGLYTWSPTGYKIGPHALFDYFLAFGLKDRLDFQKQGVEEEQIFTCPPPYFARFLPLVVRGRGNNPYRRALVLLQDYSSMAPGVKIQQVTSGVLDALAVLEESGIEIIGIKARLPQLFQRLGFHGDYFAYKHWRIPLYAGYHSFPEVARGADVVIGPVSSALIEAGLMGIDYFVFIPHSYEHGVPSLPSALGTIVKIAQTPTELRAHLKSQQPYLPGHSVFDIVDVREIREPADLYRSFEYTVADIVQRVRRTRHAS